MSPAFKDCGLTLSQVGDAHRIVRLHEKYKGYIETIKHVSLSHFQSGAYVNNIVKQIKKGNKPPVFKTIYLDHYGKPDFVERRLTPDFWLNLKRLICNNM